MARLPPELYQLIFELTPGFKSLLPGPLKEGRLETRREELGAASKDLSEAVRKIPPDPPHLLVPSADYPDVYAAVEACALFQKKVHFPPPSKSA